MYQSYSRRLVYFAGFLLCYLASPLGADIATFGHRTTDCTAGLTWDGVIWDTANVTVAPGSAPGLYSVRLLYFNSANLPGFTGNINVAIHSDGSWIVAPEFDWPALSGAYGYYFNTWTTNGYITPMTVTGDLIYHAGDICDGSNTGSTFHGMVNIVIGGSPYTKKCDRQSGGDAPGCKNCGSSGGGRRGMARYSAHSMMASLNIEDTPLGYAPPRGPAVDFTVTYNQRDSQQPSAFTYSNLGQKWTFNWLSYVIDDPHNVGASASAYVSGGGAENYSGFDANSQTYSPAPQTHAVLARLTSGNTTIGYEKRFPDGSKQVFTLSDGSTSFPRKFFMTEWVDSTGIDANAVTLTYDPNFRLVKLTDALGQQTTFAHVSDTLGDPGFYLVHQISDPFGKSAYFGYNSNHQLATITDTVGIQSIFTYSTDGSNFINSMQTPYGTSLFSTGQSPTGQPFTYRWVEMTDPQGGKERVEYRNDSVISGSESAAPAGMTNSGLDVANTFFWDKKYTTDNCTQSGCNYDYSQARVIHWTKGSDGLPTGIVANEKAPLENRVWYSYDGQSDTNHVGSTASPSQIARILDDGSTQLWQYQYNSIGKMMQSIDPVLRKINYDYDPNNNIDLVTVRQTTGGANDLLRTLSYNSLHKPLTDKDAAGQQTTYTYRADGHGQIDHVVNARGERTDYGYGDGSAGHPTDYLTSVTGPTFNSTRPITSYTYDTKNRIQTVTNSPDNYSVMTAYDDLDRPTTVTYPDATTQILDYRKYVNGVLAAPVIMTLDVGASTDRRGRVTYREYDGDRHLTKIIEPYGNSSTRTTNYGWCMCGSLTSITDPNQHVTAFNRDLESRVMSKVYDDQTSIIYAYENTTSRLKSITDAKNQRTNYLYFADDNLKQVSYTDTTGQPLNPATPTVSFAYDSNYNRVTSMADGTGTTMYGYYDVTNPTQLGATQLKTVDGPLANDTITYGYDQLGRATSQSINGVSSGVVYDALGRLDTSDDPLGHFSRLYDGDVTPRLKTLTSPTGQTSNYAYFDNSHDRRLQTLQDTTSGSTNISKFDYTYDSEGQIYPTWMKQLTSSPATTANLTYDSADELTQVVNTTPNNPSTTLDYGYDPAGNRTGDNAGTYSINDVNEITNNGYSYDTNGNLTGDGVNTYEWDAANRLTAINYPNTAGRTEFTYDGLDRRANILEKDGYATVWKTSYFVWSETTIAEERNASNTVLKRFLPEGVQLPTGTSPNTKLYYSKDHLGSIRSLTNENGTILSTLDYDAYGSIGRAPVPANDTSGDGPVLLSAISRQAHGAVGTFDLNLPLSGAPGIEMRNGSGAYQVVLTFDRNVITDTSTTIAAGAGSVSSTTFNGNTAVVQLSGVADRQTITVELDNVVGIVGANSKVLVSMSICIGDVNQDGVVTVADIDLVRGNAGSDITSSTFKYDVNRDGFINAGDTIVDRNMQNQDASLYPDFAFTGHYYHARSGFYLAPYRVYNPTIGRWLSRDPIESGSIATVKNRGQGNLEVTMRAEPEIAEFVARGLSSYNYVRNNSLNRTDRLGLFEVLPANGNRPLLCGKRDCWPKATKPGTAGCLFALEGCQVCCATDFFGADWEACDHDCSIKAAKCAAGIFQ